MRSEGLPTQFSGRRKIWSVAEISPTVRPYTERLERAVERVRTRINAISEPQRIVFTAKANRSRVIGRFGFGGACYDPHEIQLWFDPKNPNMEEHLGQTLERTIAHEYHHALRWAGPGYGAKLGAQLVSEGLAGQFVRQLYASPPEPWEAALDEENLAPWRRRAFDEFEARDHGHRNWFFGANGYPPWLGYTLGYDLIGRYLAENPSQTALSLAHAPYRQFRETLIA